MYNDLGSRATAYFTKKVISVGFKSNFDIKLARLLYITALIKMPYSIPEYPYNRMSHHITLTYCIVFNFMSVHSMSIITISKLKEMRQLPLGYG